MNYRMKTYFNDSSVEMSKNQLLWTNEYSNNKIEMNVLQAQKSAVFIVSFRIEILQ